MPLKLKDLYRITQSVQNLIQWLFSLGLLLNLEGKSCEVCDKGHFGLRNDPTFSRDGVYWKCSNKVCGKKVSIRTNSWFSNSNLTLENSVFLVYFWVYRATEEFVIHELDLSRKTLVDWFNFCREICVLILEKNSVKIGGDGHVVEIDESKFGKRKYHRGKRVDGVWVFGGIDRETKECFFKCVADRSADTLVEIIKENILPGTTIISDCWKAYSSLEKEGYKHQTVNHSVEFKNKETGACTNTIESTWRALKTFLPRNGTVKSLYDSYFSQYCIRKKFLNDAADPFLAFLSLIREQFPPSYTPSEIDKENYKQRLALQKSEAPKPRKIRVLQTIDNSSSSLEDFDV